MKTNFTNIIKNIKNGNKFAIFIHVNPDADAIGSGQALKLLLESLGKTAYLCCDDKIPSSLNFLNSNIETDDNLIDSADTYFYLDTSKADRVGKFEKYVNMKNKTIIVIDHHISQDEFGNEVIRDNTKSSTCEMIFDLYQEINAEITPEVATLLYSGISSDTGCFLHQNTTSDAHIAAAKLIELGANINLANLELFSKKPAIFTQICKYVYKNMKIYGDKLTLVTIKERDYKKLGEPESYLFISSLSHYTTDILVFITEKSKNNIKINTRSRQANVQELCAKFGGGGHKNAAGADVKDSLKNVVKKLLKEIL